MRRCLASSGMGSPVAEKPKPINPVPILECSTTTSDDDESIQAKSVAGGCLSVVVLGASGDLAKKKTFPAIFNLFKQVGGNHFFGICMFRTSLPLASVRVCMCGKRGS